MYQFDGFISFAEYFSVVSYLWHPEVQIDEEGYLNSQFEIQHNNGSNLRIAVNQKINSLDEGQEYKIISVQSILEINEYGQSWIPLEYEWTISNNVAVIDLYGRMEYICWIGGYTLRISDYRHFKMIIDQFTAVPLGLLEVNQ